MDERHAFPLRIEGLVKRYGRLEVLRGLDLSLPRGGVYGLVGLNGSGKTTTIECALGDRKPDFAVPIAGLGDTSDMVILELNGDGRSDALVLLERTGQGVRGAVLLSRGD